MKKSKVRMEDLPVYEITVEDDGTQGIRMVSLVKDPAIELKGMYFSNEELEKEKTYEFKTVQDKQIVVGPAMIPNKKILRKDENDNMYYVVFKPETIRMMVDKFNKENNNKSINVDHTNQMVDAFIQQNWIVEDPTYDKSRYYGFNNLPIGTWFIEVKVEDTKFWDVEVKEEGKFGFSIEGLMGQKMIEMESDINKFIDTLTEDEILSLFNKEEFVVEPKAGETENEFVSRCIAVEINAGHPQDQAAAICYTKWRDKSMSKYTAYKRVSFDFDGTLSKSQVQQIAEQRIKQGDNVFIITKRKPSQEVYDVAKKVGIKKDNVVFTSGKPKYSFINDLAIDEHYDNDIMETKEITEKTKAKVYKV